MRLEVIANGLGGQSMMSVLPERLQRVVTLRDLNGLSLEETGKQMRLSKERVRQLHARAMRQMRDEANKREDQS